MAANKQTTKAWTPTDVTMMVTALAPLISQLLALMVEAMKSQQKSSE